MIKRILLSFTIACATTMSIAQSPCAQSIDSRTFGNNLQQMRVIPNDAIALQPRFAIRTGVLPQFGSALRPCSALFTDDNYKFDIVAAGYPGITDRENAFSLLGRVSNVSPRLFAHTTTSIL
jgi:hypothetical protein